MGKSCCFFGSAKMISRDYLEELTEMTLGNLITQSVDTFYYCNESQFISFARRLYKNYKKKATPKLNY